MYSKYFPILQWSKNYSTEILTDDLIAAIIVTIMLIPQSLAYALLAGLPAEVGLYASILPLILYTIFGTSKSLAVGPVAVISLMTAAAASQFADQGSAEYTGIAIILALLSGAILGFMGLLKLGFIANFLSHPVISGFITASGLIIAASQLKHIFGVSGGGANLYEILSNLLYDIEDINIFTLILGVSATTFLLWTRKSLKPLAKKYGAGSTFADLISRTGPVVAVAMTVFVVWLLGLNSFGVEIVGEIPKGLPTIALPQLTSSQFMQLIGPALLISIVGYVETISVAQTLAAKKRQRIDPDQELIALGAANIGSAVSGGFPVTGGFARSVVNFDAGARTPAAGAYTAIGIAMATAFLTPLLFFLPKSTLAATIIIAVLSLVDFGAIKRTWEYSKADFTAMITTIMTTLISGVEIGIIAGVSLSIFLHLYRTSKPHMAVVGQVPGTEHFRNIKRHLVITSEKIFSLRVDESLYFPNARYLEDSIYDAVAKQPLVEDVVLLCSAINYIDSSALESLESINKRLIDSKVKLNLSEVKGPVMDRLRETHFLKELSGQIFLTQYEAFTTIDPSTIE